MHGQEATPPPGELAETNTQPDPEQIETWVKNLSAGRFAERELATQELIEAGEAAIGPVSAAVRGEGLETLERGLIVLKQLALADDEATEDAARAALEDLAKADESRAALRARRTLDMLNELRQDRAIAALRKLGATVDENTFNQFVGVWQLQTTFSVTIDDDWHGGERGLKYLRWLPDLQTVTFRGKQVQDEWLASISGLEKLAVVEINRARVSDAAVKQLGTLPSLSRLTVKYSPLTDAAIDDLKELKMASLIMLYGTKITPDGAEKLTAAAGANVKIDYRRGAFLGVGCQQTEAGCTISQVQPNSAAEKADIRVGDIITEYAGKPVPDFQTLTSLIGENVGGDTVTLKLRRGGDEELTKELTLGEWD